MIYPRRYNNDDLFFCAGSAAMPSIKMASAKSKGPCVLCYHETNSPIKRRVRNEYGRDSPGVKSIKGWRAKFKQTGSVELKRTGRPSVNEEAVDAVRDVFQSCLWKSTGRVSS